MPKDDWKRTQETIDRKRQNRKTDRTPRMKTDKRDAWRDGPLGVGLPFPMPFGKHKGKTFDQIPTDYLEWLVTLNTISPTLFKAVRKHLDSLVRPPICNPEGAADVVAEG